MCWCYIALQIEVLLLEGFEGKFIIGDLGAAIIICSMKHRCTYSNWIREKQRQPLKLCAKIRMERRIISHVPAASEGVSEAGRSPVEEIER